MSPEVIPEDALLRDAVAAIERGRKSIAVLVAEDGRLVGAITDGDIRRAILQGLRTDTPARDIATLNPVTALESTPPEDIARTLVTHALEAVPLVDAEGRFVRTAFLQEVTNLRGNPASAAGLWGAIIMAGGEGRRLRPHTQHTPKPMLLLGGIPIMERNIRALAAVGVRRFFISINYLGHVIEAHFGDGSALGISIEYLREDSPLGTGGALRLLGEAPQGPVLVMNGDLLTGLDVGRLLAFHDEQEAEITVAAKEHVIQVPFGVLQLDGSQIAGLVEKPSERFLCNAGIYVLAREAFQRLPAETAFNITTFIEQMVAGGRKVVAFPMFELWKDLGTPQELDEARAMVEIEALTDV